MFIIYNLIFTKNRFPDKKCIQGYFHPRHKMKDVYIWIDTCISHEFKSQLILSSSVTVTNNDPIHKKKTQRDADKYCFELYQSPPFRPLLDQNEDDLVTLHLAPAAVINLKWKYEPVTSTVVEFLSEELLSKAASKTESTSSISNSLVIPTGVALVNPMTNTSTTNMSVSSNETKQSTTATNSSSSTADSKSNSKEAWKPKWFKIGKQ